LILRVRKLRVGNKKNIKKFGQVVGSVIEMPLPGTYVIKVVLHKLGDVCVKLTNHLTPHRRRREISPHPICEYGRKWVKVTT